MKNAVDGVEVGSFDALLLSNEVDGLGSEIALRTLALTFEVSDGGRDRHSLSEEFSEQAVARVTAGGGEEVSKPSMSTDIESGALSTESDSQLANLSRSLRNISSLGAHFISKSIVETSTDSDDILESTSQLDSKNISSSVELESLSLEEISDVGSDTLIRASDIGGDGPVLGDFFSDHSSRDGAEPPLMLALSFHFLSSNLTHILVSTVFDSLSQVHQDDVLGNERSDRLDQVAEVLTRHSKDDLNWVQCKI